MNKTGIAVLLSLLTYTGKLGAQCSIVSSCGYTLDVNIRLLEVIPSSMSCPYGYNYNIRFSYNIDVRGANGCYNGDVGFQPQVLCNNQNNSYYTINAPAPTVGTGAASSSFSGTLTTSTNPYTSASDCAYTTPTSMNCNQVQITIFGPGLSTTTYPCSFSTLPVELADFSAAYGNNRVMLNWSTATERNNSAFLIERSLDGLSWEQIDRVEGHGNSQQLRHYEREDRSFSKGINYYRLKQTDHDGSFQYSGLVFVNTDVANGLITVYPNPVNDVLTIESGTPLAKEICIRNSLGQVIITDRIAGKGSVKMDALPGGIYYLSVTGEGLTHPVKLVKN